MQRGVVDDYALDLPVFGDYKFSERPLCHVPVDLKWRVFGLNLNLTIYLLRLNFKFRTYLSFQFIS